MIPDKLYTRKEIAAILGVDPMTVRRYEKEGKIVPVLKMKNRPRYTIESLASVAHIPEVKNTQPA